MSALALDAAPAVEELEIQVPAGGGPGDFDFGRGGGGGGDDDASRRDATLRLGIFLGTVSIFSFFTALAVIFVFRSRTLSFWTPVEVPGTLWLSTALLLVSSGSFEMARRNASANRQWLLATSLLGMAFLGCQCTSMYELAGQGLFARGNPHASLFYCFTGIHGVHLLGGLIAVNWLLMRGQRGFSREASASGNVAFYWHFMSAIWLVLFGLLLAL